MKARANTFLNVRTGTPEILPSNNPGDRYYNPGDVVDIAETVIGTDYKNNNIWHKLDDGGFVWSGGVTIDKSEQGKIDFRRAIKNIPGEWMSLDGKNIKVAILDTGFNIEHPDLKHLKDKSSLVDFGKNSTKTEDTDGHGTFLLGLLAANSSSENGIIGLIPQATFYLYKVIRDNIGFLESFVTAAINEAINQQVDIINMSFNISTEENSDLHNAIKAALKNNIIIISSAGEDNDLIEKEIVLPSGFEGVISIGEVSPGFANTLPRPLNKKIDFLMPFINQKSCSIQLDSPIPYKYDKGSSMASAMITGIVAAIMSTQSKSNPIDKLSSVSLSFSNNIISNDLQVIKI